MEGKGVEHDTGALHKKPFRLAHKPLLVLCCLRTLGSTVNQRDAETAFATLQQTTRVPYTARYPTVSCGLLGGVGVRTLTPGHGQARARRIFAVSTQHPQQRPQRLHEGHSRQFSPSAPTWHAFFIA